MSYFASTRPDITESIPALLSARAAAATFSASGIAFDIAIADLPFLLAPTKQNPYRRQTADFRKQQFDSSKEAGEQSLDQAQWIRSLTSCHNGAGINFYEPGSDDGTAFRFNSSVGVDVWTQGQVTLLHALEKKTTVAGPVNVTTAIIGGTDYYLANSNGTLSKNDGTTATAFTGSTSLVGVPVVTGANVVVGASTQMWKGALSGTTVTSMAFTGVTGDLIPYWVKSRIIASNSNSLYELTLASTGALPTALYTHPDSGWTWTSITETTDAILAAGYSNGYGAIYRFSLETNGSGVVPKLGQPFQISEFPPGETVHSIKAYLGKYIAIGTNRGLRIGIITGQTSVSPTVIQYGPLLFTTTYPVVSLSARDQYIYAAVKNHIDGNSGVVRVSLEAPIGDTLRFPYANDVNTHITGTVDSIAFLGNSGRVVLGLEGDGAWLQSATTYETTGYLQTGKIRFDTSEPKAYRTARIRALFPAVSNGISLSTFAPGGTEAFIIRLDGTFTGDDGVAISRPVGTFEYVTFKLTFDGNGTDTAVLNNFTIRALPAPRRQRLISYPILLFDTLRAPNGQDFGAEGYAKDVLLAMEELESSSAVVLVKDLRTGESFDASIEQTSFVSESDANNAGPNFGGFLTVVARKL